MLAFNLRVFQPESQEATIDQGFVVPSPILELVAGFRLLHASILGDFGFM
jgi:hypothetical protein